MTELSSGEHIANQLIRIGAVTLSPEDPFTWASGLRSPIYCDNRATLAYPEVRSSIADAFAARIVEIDPAVDAVIGVATGAIAHASFVAERMDLPMGYVRATAKGHGRKNRLEGFVKAGSRVVVIEDLVSTGGSSLAAVEAVREGGLEVAGLLAIFTYGFQSAVESFAAADVPFETLATFSDMLVAARAADAIGGDGEQLLRDWSGDPRGWSDRHGS